MRTMSASTASKITSKVMGRRGELGEAGPKITT
jgi:hypothetical protein